MTVFYLRDVAYICNGCGLETWGKEHRMPPRWEKVVNESGRADFCPACKPPEPKP